MPRDFANESRAFKTFDPDPKVTGYLASISASSAEFGEFEASALLLPNGTVGGLEVHTVYDREALSLDDAVSLIVLAAEGNGRGKTPQAIVDALEAETLGWALALDLVAACGEFAE